jgi:hypothetical protein
MSSILNLQKGIIQEFTGKSFSFVKAYHARRPSCKAHVVGCRARQMRLYNLSSRRRETKRCFKTQEADDSTLCELKSSLCAFAKTQTVHAKAQAKKSSRRKGLCILKCAPRPELIQREAGDASLLQEKHRPPLG